MANKDKFKWEKGDVVVSKKVYKGKEVDYYPWEKPKKQEKKPEKK